MSFRKAQTCPRCSGDPLPCQPLRRRCPRALRRTEKAPQPATATQKPIRGGLFSSPIPCQPAFLDLLANPSVARLGNCVCWYYSGCEFPFVCNRVCVPTCESMRRVRQNRSNLTLVPMSDSLRRDRTRDRFVVEESDMNTFAAHRPKLI